MQRREIDSIISEHPFFKGFEPRLLKILAGCASNRRFKPGEFLMREGRSADRFFLIRRGRVSVETHAPHRGPNVIQTLQAGDVLGWSWLIPPYHWRFDARAAEEVLAAALDGKCLREKCENDFELGYRLLQRLSMDISSRLEATRLQLQDLYAPRQ